MIVRKLNVLESPILHDKPADAPPVHVVYDNHEFDWWEVTKVGNLEIGKMSAKAGTSGKFEEDLEHFVTTVIACGWFFKVWEDAVEHPDARATATVTGAVAYTGALVGDDDGMIPPVEAEEAAREGEVQTPEPDRSSGDFDDADSPGRLHCKGFFDDTTSIETRDLRLEDALLPEILEKPKADEHESDQAVVE
jgi:hypothetical protein